MDPSAQYSPSPTERKGTKTTFLTPCRRLGLARKSPASAGSWHANKPSPTLLSPNYNPPFQVTPEKRSDTQSNDNDCPSNEVTPSRNMSRVGYKGVLSKRFKSSYPLSVHTGNEGEENAILVREKLQREMSDTSSENGTTNNIAGCGNALLSEIDMQTEPTLPADVITEEMIEEIKVRVKKKEEKLEELKRANIYKKKHDVTTLQKLIERWLEGCQAALQELQSLLLMQGHHLTMAELLRQLNIPHQLVKYRTDLEDFE